MHAGSIPARASKSVRVAATLICIIDHGSRYFTVYGNLTATEVKISEDVVTGAALGSVVNRKGESVLYFELREEGRPVDPSPWLGL